MHTSATQPKEAPKRHEAKRLKALHNGKPKARELLLMKHNGKLILPGIRE
jgi:hypothetical protein